MSIPVVVVMFANQIAAIVDKWVLVMVSGRYRALACNTITELNDYEYVSSLNHNLVHVKADQPTSKPSSWV